ncbi:class I SAM-dependent methyltransferase [Saccharothrix deserti]|uniref:class I SAM-dependent methyltransferase n=1 Tax=Saccharothrix deserti TaxID=2593674 RepID=UPI00236783DA|nr:methyltransferase domain-containing protein [Saccharothrix deserti]
MCPTSRIQDRRVPRLARPPIAAPAVRLTSRCEQPRASCQCRSTCAASPNRSAGSPPSRRRTPWCWTSAPAPDGCCTRSRPRRADLVLGGVDLVVSTSSMHEWPDRRRAVAELGRVLRPGGVLVVQDFRFARVERELFSGFLDVRRVPVRPAWWPVALFSRPAASAP